MGKVRLTSQGTTPCQARFIVRRNEGFPNQGILIRRWCGICGSIIGSNQRRIFTVIVVGDGPIHVVILRPGTTIVASRPIAIAQCASVVIAVDAVVVVFVASVIVAFAHPEAHYVCM